MQDNNKRCLQECLLKHILLQPSLVTNLKLIVIIHFPMQLFNKSTVIARGNPVINYHKNKKLIYRWVQK